MNNDNINTVDIKLQKVMFVLSRTNPRLQMKYILDTEYILNINDFMYLYKENLCSEFKLSANDCTVVTIKQKWSELQDQERLKLMHKFICENNFLAYLKTNLSIYYNNYLLIDDLNIHWIYLSDNKVVTREELVEILLNKTDSDKTDFDLLSNDTLVNFYNTLKD